MAKKAGNSEKEIKKGTKIKKGRKPCFFHSFTSWTANIAYICVSLCIYRCRQVHMVRYSENLCADRAFIFIIVKRGPSICA